MFTATFIFKPGNLNSEFFDLDERIEDIVQKAKGYLGRKKWTDEDGNVAVVYYWASLSYLDSFRSNMTHGLAKSRYAEWYAGYRVEISEVKEIYGDGYFDNDFPEMG